MARNALSSIFLISVTFFFGCSQSTKEGTLETKVKEFKFDCGYECTLENWLMDSVYSSQPKSSQPTWAFFYFKVNASGGVDSLFHRGTINEQIADRMKYNIKKTSGHWIIPEKTHQTEYQWFVVPIFNFGEIPCLGFPNCNECDSTLQRYMESFYYGMNNMHTLNENLNVKMMNSMGFGGGLVKM
ncbi:hypothetical protein [Arundinibacter roseus]|uniref:Lipoprotein n=1 Tax=Arundinibacter roseus TaxID=2070510 RepID=A0A4R4JZF0_9BACT|nr:hypothetical protein [Arundinibacter roseus]TDB59516.1 hypothetical protein EZE20_22180 [Arundinibacter roseus]